MAYYCRVIIQKHLLGILCIKEKVFNSVKDTNKILEKERSKNVAKALIIDAVESHLSSEQNVHEMASIAKQLV